MHIDIFEFEKEKEVIKRKDTIRDIMIKSKYLCMDLINNILKLCYLKSFVEYVLIDLFFYHFLS